MPIDAAERDARRIVDALRATIEIETAHDTLTIRDAAIELFTRQLDGKLANLRNGETLQVSFRIDIAGVDGSVRGGSGAERNMPEYIVWRDAVYRRDNRTCQAYGQRSDLNAHHIKAWASHPELRFDVDNGQTLCASCHRTRHGHLRASD